MATATSSVAGTLTLGVDTLTLKRYVTDATEYISPTDAPLWSYLQGANAESKFNIVNLPGHIIEWLEDDIRPLASTVDNSGTLGGGAGDVTLELPTGHGAYFRVGDVLIIEDEGVWVSAVTGDDLTISRAFFGSRVAHAEGVAVERFTIAQVEGMEYKTSSSIAKGNNDNYIQIFEDTAEESYINERVSRYAVGDALDDAVAKKIPEMMRNLDKTLYRGRKVAATATTPYAMGGFAEYITINTSGNSSTALTIKAFEDAVQTCWSAGGNPKLVVCNQWGLRKIRSFYENMVRTTQDDTRGGITIDSVRTFAGDLDILLDRWCPATKMYILDPNFIGIYEFQPWAEEPVPSTAMTTRRRVWGVYSMVVKHNKAHAIITYSTSS